MVTYVPPVVCHLADRLDDLGWVTDLLVAGSLATGDYVPGVSDLDLVALTRGPVGPARQGILASLHRELDRGSAQGLDLGCVYVDAGRLADFGVPHPTWTHGLLVQRILSGVTRAELARHGFAVLGRPPAAVLPEGRQGQRVASPRVRTALIAWRDARRTVASARRRAPA